MRLSKSGDSPTLRKMVWGPGGRALIAVELIGFFDLTMVVVRGEEGDEVKWDCTEHS